MVSWRINSTKLSNKEKLNKMEDPLNKPQKKDRRFTLVTEIYLNKAPNNASEAYSRFCEQFFNL